MPNGFWYASGEYTTHEGTAASAFSQGDLLALSTSSLSRVNPYALASGVLFGVAASDSTNSINGKCVAIVPGPDTLFWGRVTAGQALGTGANSGISFATALGGRYECDASTTTNAFVVVKGPDSLDQSVQSRVLGKFKYAAGELDLS